MNGSRGAILTFAVALLLPAAALAATGVAEADATSWLGKALVPPELPPDVRAEREGRLAEARERVATAPGDADALIWLGRRLAYLGRYREALEVFSRGIALHPEDPRLYRHRGHRFITTRRLDEALADLELAAELLEGTPDEVEPDGLPNARGIPTSTLHTNVWYHLGLARYLRADFEGARSAYESCMAAATNPDMRVATAHWLYMTLRRLGRDAEADAWLEPFGADLDVIENHAYHALLLFYRGEIDERGLVARAGGDLDDATLGYGLANWRLYNGRARAARRGFRRVVTGSQWAAFGYLAAEAELARR